MSYREWLIIELTNSNNHISINNILNNVSESSILSTQLSLINLRNSFAVLKAERFNLIHPTVRLQYLTHMPFTPCLGNHNIGDNILIMRDFIITQSTQTQTINSSTYNNTPLNDIISHVAELSYNQRQRQIKYLRTSFSSHD